VWSFQLFSPRFHFQRNNKYSDVRANVEGRTCAASACKVALFHTIGAPDMDKNGHIKLP